MSGAQSYIVRVLRKVEAAFHDGEYQAQRLVVGKAFYRISHAEEVNAALERLYCVHGFDQFALRLMWLYEHAGNDLNRIEGAVIDHDIETLIATLRPPAPVEDEHGARIETLTPVQDMETFHDALHRFGRVLEEVKRRSFEGALFVGADEDLLNQVLAETHSLQKAAQTVGQGDVMKFSTACASFLQYALDHSLTHDVRVVNMLENANLTLQTVLAASGTEDYDSLHKNVELLQNPKDLLS